MDELELLLDLHVKGERQGPGSTEATLRALEMITLPSEKELKVADMGCGTGAQSLVLAGQLTGQVTAVDLFPAFLDELTKKAKEMGLSEKIVTCQQSMDDLPFRKEQFDLIWSEGAIYTIGFEEGIRQWKEYLKVGGYLAVSEVTWVSSSRPKEIVEFWSREYPEIGTAATKINQLEANGYTLVGYFFLSPQSWLSNYYKPLQERFPAFLTRHKHSELAKKVVAAHQQEINLYERHQAHYSYGFYIARKDAR
ncbi:Methyltransferase domain-containing protein [Cyclobacterium xiamenense]|uniref:Methyltransferase domain-containing protein n=1 Tax=Cyclobacterium xiamenense TaxID=1297121 RepID=A0A1H7AYM8_9BACT|nr:class I SAM-dependent methyltransferase [Cyclobacterium xiamenense]SEJ70711.1 Methyltransferase domain-containing protein [Cyclobacterium xiamenense]